MTGDPRLSVRAKEVFLDPNQELYLSAASFWETDIKISPGKLAGRFIEQSGPSNDIDFLYLTLQFTFRKPPAAFASCRTMRGCMMR